MKLVTFRHPRQSPSVGALLDGQVLDLALAYEQSRGVGTPLFADMNNLVRGGQDALDIAREMVDERPRDALWPVEEVELLPPLSPPDQVRVIDWDRSATHWALQRYLGRHSVGTGAAGDVLPPEEARDVTLAAGLAAVIGRRCYAIRAREANRYILGFMLYAAFRAAGPAGEDWLEFDGALRTGPLLVTADEYRRRRRLKLELRIDEQTQADGESAPAAALLQALVTETSAVQTLYPGELLLMPPALSDVALADGQSARLSAAGMGTLSLTLRRA